MKFFHENFDKRLFCMEISTNDFFAWKFRQTTFLHGKFDKRLFYMEILINDFLCMEGMTNDFFVEKIIYDNCKWIF